MALSPKQTLSWIASTTQHNFTIWNGSIRSGKTIISLIAFLSWLPEAPEGPIAIIGKTRDTIQRNIIDVIRLIEPNSIGGCTTKATSVRIMDRLVWLIGANDNQAEEKIRGMTLAGAYVDEATLLPEAMFVQLLGRLSVTGARLFATTNPDNPYHWLKTNYLDKAEELGWGVWHFTMDDNPGLSPEYIAAKKREFTGLWYRRFIQGEWVSAEGAVYNMWDPARHVIKWADLPDMRDFLGVGIDYGTTNASAGVLLGLGTDNKLYAVDEWRVDSTEMTRYTDSELSTSLREWMRRPHVPPGKRGEEWGPRFLLIDPAAASFKAQLARDGLRNIQPANNSVNDGIRNTATLLAENNLLIADKCASLIREIPGYSWDPKATALGEDKPIKKDDHSLDALRYAVHTTETLWRKHLPKTGGIP